MDRVGWIVEALQIGWGIGWQLYTCNHQLTTDRVSMVYKG